MTVECGSTLRVEIHDAERRATLKPQTKKPEASARELGDLTLVPR